MCLNFIPSRNQKWIANHFSVTQPKKFNEEIYPGYYCPIIRAGFDAGDYKCELAHFGLIPSWAGSVKPGKHTYNVRGESMTANHLPNLHRETYNARSETVSSKPSFRTAWNRRHFALVIADGFMQPNYETGAPIRWKVSKSDGSPLALACLWERWVNVDLGEDTISFCILTTDASSHPLLKRFHKPCDAKRSPIIIPNTQLNQWLNANIGKANELIGMELPNDLIAIPYPKVGKKNEVKQSQSEEA